MNYFIGADLGTSSLKLLLVSETGEIKAETSRDYPVCYPKSNWSEQNPADWWTAFVSGVKELISGVNAADVAAICVAGQMHGLAILDSDDNVIRPAILWNDGRTEKQTEYLNTCLGEENLLKHTGNIAFAGFTAPKLLWLKENEPENFSKISKIMLPKDYVNYKLTGVHCTDYSDASGFLLLDVQNKRWSKEMLEICSVSEDQMPTLFESYEIVGNLLPEVAKELGLREIPVCAGAGDNAGAAVGTGTVGEGKCNISLGTSGTIFISSEKYTFVPGGKLHSFCHADGGYHLMGVVLSAASCNKWFYEEILKSTDYNGLQEEINEEDLGENEVFFLPYLMGERSPINDTNTRGTFVGMTFSTKRSHMVQAVLEGVAFAFRDNLETVKAQGVNVSFATVCGGGAKSKLWQQILADVLNLPLSLPVTEQGPAFGAAMLSMVALKKYENVAECAKAFTKYKQTVFPDEKRVLKYEKKYQKFKKIYPEMKGLFAALQEEEI